MSSSNISTRRTQKPPAFTEVEGFQSKKIVLLKLNVNSHTIKVNSPPNTSLSSKIGNNESLPDLKSENKSKTDFNRSRLSSSKSSLRSFSNFLTSSYARGTYLSITKKLKSIEQVKLLALQAEEHSKRILKLLEKSVELGSERLLFEAAETRDKIALAKLET